MGKKKRKIKRVSLIKVIIKWFQLSFDEALTIGVWILMWSILEPYVMRLPVNIRILMILLAIIILQRDVTKILKQKKKKKG